MVNTWQPGSRSRAGWIGVFLILSLLFTNVASPAASAAAASAAPAAAATESRFKASAAAAASAAATEGRFNASAAGATAPLLQPLPTNLTITPITWDVIGLDSNNENVGPNEFLVGARVCNTGPVDAVNVVSTLVWDSANPYINATPGSLTTISLPSLAAGACTDFYYNVTITRTDAARETSRDYHITASADNAAPVSTPPGRQLFVENLVSQNRNEIISITCPLAAPPPGTAACGGAPGNYTVVVGQTYEFTFVHSTGPGGFEQLESFLGFPNLLFRLISVESTYTQPPGHTSDVIYQDACGWDPINRVCLGPRDTVGGDIVSTYRVEIIGPGEADIAALIYDFSGSSYHYNSDFDTLSVHITALAPDVTLQKTDGGISAVPGGTLAYQLIYTELFGMPVSGITLTETVPLYTTFNPAASTPGWVCVPSNLPGAACTLNAPALPAGATGTTTFALTVANPLSAGAQLVTNMATVAAPGETNLTNNTAADFTPLIAAPDLVIAKTDRGDSAVPGGPVMYTLDYTNAGSQGATGVVITETVPANTIFNPAASTPGWTCAPNNLAGAVCTHTVGSLAAGASGSVTFELLVDNPLPAGVSQISNTANIADDGANGPDPTPASNTSSDTTPVIAAPDLLLTKTDDGVTAAPGDTIAYTLNYANTGNQGAAGVVLTETVPAGAAFDAAASTAGWSCADGAPAGSACTFTVGSLAAGTSGTLTFAVTVDPLLIGGAIISNTAAIADDGANGPDPVPANNTSSDTTPVVGVPDLSLAKTAPVTETLPGGSLVYSLAYANNGNQAALGVVLTETLPANTTFNPAASAAGWVCAPDNTAGSTCTLTVGTVPAGAGGTRAFAVTVDPALPAGVSLIHNAASVADDGTYGPDPTPTDNTAVLDLPVAAAPDLQITKSDRAAAPVPGDPLIYDLLYANVGSQAAAGVVITETVPANTTFDAASSTTGWSCADGAPAGTVCTLTIGTLASGASGTAAFAVTVDPALPAAVEVLNNTVIIADNGANGADPNPQDNTGSAVTPLTAAPDLSIIKDDEGVTRQPGQTVTYALRYANNGSQAAAGVTITETVPADTTFNAALSDAGWSCADAAPAGTTCTYLVGPLAAGANGSVSFAVTIGANLPATVTEVVNSTSIADDGNGGPDPTPGDNTFAIATPVSGQPDLSITKSDDGAGALPGGALVYTLTYANQGVRPASNVVITETVPANTTFDAANSTAGWSCADGAPAATVCTFSIPTLAAGANGGVIFAVTVDSPLPAGVTQVANTAVIADDGANGADPTPGNNTATDTTPLTAAPDLSITKSDGVSAVAPGAELTYTLTVANQGSQGATGVAVVDPLPLGLAFVSASDGGTYDSASRQVVWPSFDLAAGAQVTRTLTARVDNPLPAGLTSIANTAVVSDDGANGADPDPGNNTGGDTDRLAVAGKSLTATDQDFTAGSAVAVGEILTYQVTLDVAPGLLVDVLLTDVLDPGLAFIDCEVIAGPELTAAPVALGQVCAQRRTIAAEPPDSTDPANAGRSMTLNFGGVANDSPVNQPLVVQYRVAVLDSAGNTRGTSLTNQARWQWNGGTLDLVAAPVRLIEPELSLQKTVSPTSALPGSVVTYTLTVAHTAASDSGAFEVHLTDLLPAQLTYVPGTLALVSGTPPTALSDAAAPTLAARWDTFPLGSSAALRFQARVGSSSAGQAVRNTAALDWTSIPGQRVSPTSPYNRLSTERRYIPGSAVDVYGTSASVDLGVSTPVTLPETGFAPEVITPLPAQPAARAYTTLDGLWLEVPALKLRLPITGVPLEEEGWDLTWLGSQAGWLESTAFPGWEGRSVLTAHATGADGRPGPFARLNSLRWGDDLLVHAFGQVYRFEVRAVDTTTPDDLSVLEHAERPTLTLITCRQFDVKTGTYKQRVVVEAVLVDID